MAQTRAPAPDREHRHVQAGGEIGHAREDVGVAGEVDLRGPFLEHEAEGRTGRPQGWAFPIVVGKRRGDPDRTDGKDVARIEEAAGLKEAEPMLVARRS